MEKISVQDLYAKAAKVFNAVEFQNFRFILTRRGRPAAVLIPLADLKKIAGITKKEIKEALEAQ